MQYQTMEVKLCHSRCDLHSIKHKCPSIKKSIDPPYKWEHWYLQIQLQFFCYWHPWLRSWTLPASNENRPTNYQPIIIQSKVNMNIFFIKGTARYAHNSTRETEKSISQQSHLLKGHLGTIFRHLIQHTTSLTLCITIILLTTSRGNT